MAIITISVGNLALASGAVHRQGGPSVGLAGDCLTFDGVAAIQYVQAGAKTVTKGIVTETSPVAYTVPHALRRQVSIRQVAMSGGKLRMSDAIFEIPQLELSITPREGDRIHVGGARWDVIACDSSTLNTRWRVYARSI